MTCYLIMHAYYATLYTHRKNLLKLIVVKDGFLIHLIMVRCKQTLPIKINRKCK